MLTSTLAFWSLPGYTFKGIYKELQNRLGSSVQNYIVAARTAQGYDDWRNSTEAERIDVISRWHATKVELVENKRLHQGRSRSPRGFMKTRHMTFDERKQYAKRKNEEKENQSSGKRSLDPGLEGETSYTPDIVPGQEVFEEAIRNSVAATSKGNPTEDALIERAIRASVTELQVASQEGDDDAIHRAIQASVIEASKTDREQDANEKYRQQLEAALQMSMEDCQVQNAEHRESAKYTEDDSGVETDDDENIKMALEESKTLFNSLPARENMELQKALDQSRQHQETRKAERSEEEIVLDYIKRQSFAEAQHRQRVTTKPPGIVSDDSEHDQELQHAIEESRKAYNNGSETFQE